MTLQHSPGPWSFHTDAEGWMSIQDAEARCVTEIGRDIDANARLMKAAPEMLRLLRLIARIPLEQANLGIGPVTAIREARKMLKELDGDT